MYKKMITKFICIFDEVREAALEGGGLRLDPYFDHFLMLPSASCSKVHLTDLLSPSSSGTSGL